MSKIWKYKRLEQAKRAERRGGTPTMRTRPPSASHASHRRHEEEEPGPTAQQSGNVRDYILRRDEAKGAVEAERRRRRAESDSAYAASEEEESDSAYTSGEEESDSTYTSEEEESEEEESEKRKDWITCRTCIQTSSVHRKRHSYDDSCAASDYFKALTHARQQPLLERLKKERAAFLKSNQGRYPYGKPRTVKYRVGAGFDTSPKSKYSERKAAEQAASTKSDRLAEVRAAQHELRTKPPKNVTEALRLNNPAIQQQTNKRARQRVRKGPKTKKEPDCPIDELVLPKDWVKRTSKRENRVYFFNTRTNDSTWSPMREWTQVWRDKIMKQIPGMSGGGVFALYVPLGQV